MSRQGARGLELTCAGDAVLVPVEAGLTRCTQGGCGPVASPGDFADLTSDGLVTATQRGDRVRVERTHAAATAHDAPVEIPLAPGDRLVGLVVWKDAPTLIVLGTSRRLHLVVP